MPRTIKRYANRKLYDTAQSCYVTLDEIARLVEGGEEVRIIDNDTKDDLTSVTLAQIVVEAEKNKTKLLPLHTLRGLVQSGGELLEKTIARPVQNLRQETGKRVTLAREAVSRTEDETRERVSQLVGSTQRSWEDFQRRVDERVKTVVSTMVPGRAAQDEVQLLRDRVEVLEARLAALEAQKGNG